MPTMSSFDLSSAPEFGQQNGWLYQEAFGSSMPGDPCAAIEAATRYANAVALLFDRNVMTIPGTLALRTSEGNQARGSCRVISQLVHTLLAAYPDPELLNPMIGSMYTSQYPRGHSSNPILVGGELRLAENKRTKFPDGSVRNHAFLIPAGLRDKEPVTRGILTLNATLTERIQQSSAMWEEQWFILEGARFRNIVQPTEERVASLLDNRPPIPVQRLVVFSKQMSNDIVDGSSLPNPTAAQKRAADLYEQAITGRLIE